MATTKSSQDSFIPDDQTIVQYKYEYYYLAVVILELIVGSILLLMFGYLLLSFKDKDLFWFFLLGMFIMFPLSIFIFFQYFGWKGYLHRDVKSVKIYAVCRIIAVALLFLKLIQDLHDGILIGITSLIISMIMAYVSIMFSEELVTSQQQ